MNKNKIPHTILVLLEAKAGKEEDLKKMLQYLVDETMKEDGCVHYFLHQSLDDPTQFMFYENWADKEAHAKHSQTPHLQAWRANRVKLLAKQPVVTPWRMIAS